LYAMPSVNQNSSLKCHQKLENFLKTWVKIYAMPVKRILVVADMVHPYIYRDTFPSGLEPLDLVLAAGDLPGYFMEFVATRVTCPFVWVHGNHGEETVKDCSCGGLNDCRLGRRTKIP
jgi:hypothetical protein